MRETIPRLFRRLVPRSLKGQVLELGLTLIPNSCPNRTYDLPISHRLTKPPHSRPSSPMLFSRSSIPIRTRSAVFLPGVPIHLSRSFLRGSLSLNLQYPLCFISRLSTALQHFFSFFASLCALHPLANERLLRTCRLQAGPRSVIFRSLARCFAC